jgi:hypothetical protein
LLQDKLEVLPGVDRAFVHVDHETTHAPVGRLLGLLPPITPPILIDIIFVHFTGTSKECLSSVNPTL